MLCLAGVLKEVRNAYTLRTRRGDDELVSALVRSAAAKISLVQLWDSAAALEFERAMGHVEFGEELTTVLADAADKRTRTYTEAAIGSTKAAGGAPAREQELRCPFNYLTATDNDQVDDPATSADRRDRLVMHRLAACGIRRAGEDALIKYAVALIIDAEFKLNNYKWFEPPRPLATPNLKNLFLDCRLQKHL